MKPLPYTKTTTFTLDGVMHSNEQEALRAAIEKVIGNPGVSKQVISECCDLAPLLSRACELNMGKPPEPPKPKPEQSEPSAVAS